MTDERHDGSAQTGAAARPRPAYGEYATPEEQRARIQQPDATYALETGRDPANAAAHVPAAPVAPAPASTAARAGGRRVDLIAACVLLGYGLVNVIVTILQMRDFTTFADQFFRTAGIQGEFTNIASGQQWGAIGSVVLAAGWLLTAVVTLLHARRGRLVWWIPLVGAVVSFALFTVCLTVPMVNDPAVMSFFLRS